jgi:hypothetical protein
MVYPSDVYSTSRVPALFDPLTPEFEHPQLFAALGYGVLLPSMPGFDAVLKNDSIPELGAGVLPAIDALVSRGIADPGRIALIGQSAGGWARLGLLTTTSRFRTALAGASYSNLESLFGTFYSQCRYGDSGDRGTRSCSACCSSNGPSSAPARRHGRRRALSHQQPHHSRRIDHDAVDARSRRQRLRSRAAG